MEGKENKKLSKENLQKIIVYGLLFIGIAIAIYLVFGKKSDNPTQEGLNTELPAPKDQGIEGNKKSAYEMAKMKESQQEKSKTLEDFQAMVGIGSQEEAGLGIEANTDMSTPSATSAERKRNAVGSSVAAYQDINRTLGNFYEKPQVDPEKERLKNELSALRNEISRKQSENNIVDDQVKLLEKSYQMAAKYLPQNGAKPEPSQVKDTNSIPTVKKSTLKSNVVPVRRIRPQVVSTLGNPIDSKAPFITAVGEESPDMQKNTIEACIHENQTVIAGQAVKIRLVEPVKIDQAIIPKGSILIASANITGDRLSLIITSVEYDGTISPVELQVYDSDGQRGIYIPSSMEAGALKEIGAGAGQQMGTSINISQSTSQQLVGDLSKGLIQGTSQYLSRKVKQVKVKLKAGHRIFLLPKQQ